MAVRGTESGSMFDVSGAVQHYTTEYARGEPHDSDGFEVLQTAIDALMTAVALEVARQIFGFHKLVVLVFVFMAVLSLALHVTLLAGGWVWRTRYAA